MDKKTGNEMEAEMIFFLGVLTNILRNTRIN